MAVKRKVRRVATTRMISSLQLHSTRTVSSLFTLCFSAVASAVVGEVLVTISPGCEQGANTLSLSPDFKGLRLFHLALVWKICHRALSTRFAASSCWSVSFLPSQISAPRHTLLGPNGEMIGTCA